MTDAFESFIELARQDIDAAKKLVREADHSGRAAFFVEQAAEKMIKAVLSVEGIIYPASHHQLGVLAALLPPDHEWRTDFSSFDAFTSFATKFRYPTSSGKLPINPAASDVSEYIEEVAAILDDVLDWCRDAVRGE